MFTSAPPLHPAFPYPPYPLTRIHYWSLHQPDGRINPPTLSNRPPHQTAHPRSSSVLHSSTHSLSLRIWFGFGAFPFTAFLHPPSYPPHMDRFLPQPALRTHQLFHEEDQSNEKVAPCPCLPTRPHVRRACILCSTRVVMCPRSRTCSCARSPFR